MLKRILVFTLTFAIGVASAGWLTKRVETPQPSVEIPHTVQASPPCALPLQITIQFPYRGTVSFPVSTDTTITMPLDTGDSLHRTSSNQITFACQDVSGVSSSGICLRSHPRYPLADSSAGNFAASTSSSAVISTTSLTSTWSVVPDSYGATSAVQITSDKTMKERP